MKTKILIGSLILLAVGCTSQPQKSEMPTLTSAKSTQGSATRNPASDAGIQSFFNTLSSKDNFQERPSCVVYAIQETPNADSEDTMGFEEHSGISDVAVIQLDKATSGKSDVGSESISIQEGKQYAPSFSDKFFYVPTDRQYVQGGSRTYRITASRKADLFRNSCPTPEQERAESKDHSWTLNIEEGITLYVEKGYSYTTNPLWKPLYNKKMEAEDAPESGYKMHKMKIRNLNLYYRCTTYIPNCVG